VLDENANDRCVNWIIWPFVIVNEPHRRAAHPIRFREGDLLSIGPVHAGTDFFTAEVLTLRRLATYYVLFFIHLESRRVDIAGITVQPDEPWMKQIARNVIMEGCGVLRNCCYLLHDRDTKYTQSFRAIIASGRIEPLALPAQSPNLNSYAERWVRSVKEECLSKVVLFGERSLRRALNEYVEHFHAERNHQGKGNVLLFPRGTHVRREGPVQCRERLGGLLRYYHQEAA
jgi:putative transposase